MQRGFTFDTAAAIFSGVVLNREDRRRDYGEQRFISTGEFGGRLITVVWTPRGDRRRIISAWRASNRERREYRDYREEVAATDPRLETPD
ncbi:MAG: BrnT family toxin [Chloroflexi bacterium]|nr:BrnT family toxin [Chloroflexota bacterium]